MKNTPNFIIVGAPKCGTTSLYFYLQQHPNIFMPHNKEPRFFCNINVHELEFGKKQFHPDIVWEPSAYESLFADAPPGALTGEASTDYLSTPGTAARIYAWNPCAKIIIMLRDPLSRAFSEYRHSIAANLQHYTFSESIQLEERRFSERFDPIFGHVRRGLYAENVRDYLEIFGEKNVKVIFFDDFGNRTTEVVADTFNFLGLVPHAVDTSERYNVDNAGSPRFDSKSEKGSRSWLDRFRTRLKKQRVGAAAALTRREYNALRSRFVNDVRMLEELLDVDLKHWLHRY